MSKPASRAHQARFIASFDSMPGSTAADAVLKCLRRYGLSWLTDEQLSEITADVVDEALLSTRHRARNRRVLRGLNLHLISPALPTTEAVS